MVKITEYKKVRDSWEVFPAVPVNRPEELLRQCHYIAFAVPGVSYAANYLAGTKYKSRHTEIFDEINSKNTAGTFYPEYSATFLPVQKVMAYMNEAEKEKAESEIRSYFKSVERAESLMNTAVALFDIRDFGVIDNEFYKKVAIEELMKFDKLKEIIIMEYAY